MINKFSDFLFESEKLLNESFQSSIMQKLQQLSQSKNTYNISKEFSKYLAKLNIKVDQILDEDFEIIDPSQGNKKPYTDQGYIVIFTIEDTTKINDELGWNLDKDSKGIVYVLKDGQEVHYRDSYNGKTEIILTKEFVNKNFKNIITNKKKAAMYASHCYVLNLNSLSEKYSSKELINSRHNSKKDANMGTYNSKQKDYNYNINFKNNNIERYKKLMAENESAESIFQIGLDAMNVISLKIEEKTKKLKNFSEFDWAELISSNYNQFESFFRSSTGKGYYDSWTAISRLFQQIEESLYDFARDYKDRYINDLDIIDKAINIEFNNFKESLKNNPKYEGMSEEDIKIDYIEQTKNKKIREIEYYEKQYKSFLAQYKDKFKQYLSLANRLN